MSAVEHQRETLRSSGGQLLWCLKGAAYWLTTPLRRLPLCRLGLHEWCACCSPVSCVRCDKQGHD